MLWIFAIKHLSQHLIPAFRICTARISISIAVLAIGIWKQGSRLKSPLYAVKNVKNVNFWPTIACHISKKLSGMCQSPSAIMSEASGLQKSKIHRFFLHLSYLPTDGRFDVAVNKNSKNHQFWSYWRPRPLKSCVLTCQTRSINNPVQFLLGTLWKIKKSGQNCFDLSNLRSYIGFQGTQSCVFCLVIHLQVFSMTKFHSSSVAFIPKKISRPLLKY